MDSPSGFKRAVIVLAVPIVMSMISVAAGCSTNDSITSNTTTTADTNTAGDRTDPGGSDSVDPHGAIRGTLARYEGFRSDVYEDPASWLCRPDAVDVCDSNLDVTVVAADGTLTVEEWHSDPDAPIDCFYVYPTISRDETQYSDMDASPEEEGAAALNQVARLGSACRVFAPIYRQRTLAGLAGAFGGSAGGGNSSRTGGGNSTGGSGSGSATTTVAPGSLDFDDPYSDVLEAWKSYMARDNQGRGVVLIGHSQGAGLLKRLLQGEFDPDDNQDVRDVLVSAFLAGTSVWMPVDADDEPASLDADLTNVGLCTSVEQTGCVVTWSTYRQTSPPPPDGLFGRPDPSRPELRAACVNPARLSAGRSPGTGDQPADTRPADTRPADTRPADTRPAEAHAYLPAIRTASMLTGSRTGNDIESDDGSGNEWVEGSTDAITTPFVTVPGLLSVRCAEHDGHVYLEMTTTADPGPRVDDIGGDLTPQWGMHLQDVNIVMGDILSMISDQTRVFIGASGASDTSDTSDTSG